MGQTALRDNSRMNMEDNRHSSLDIGLQWHNRFAQLGPDFFTPLAPHPLPEPYWVGRSTAVARTLGLDPAWLDAPELLQALSGNQPIKGTQPLASVYSGHQFGQWAGQLGDGRAILLGETAQGQEVQLKGAGLTPYSRMGDGRAVLRSSIREFLCSEAMHGLGVPTSRALCVTGSDAPVRRETLETAAVVTRVAPSFVRFGHFEHFSSRNQTAQLKTLADHVIDHFYPACRDDTQFGGNAYAALLQAVSERTATMVAYWQAVGFCHGVMNTDNMSMLGLTIDYGPFQFLDAYAPGHICNHSDHAGRYAYNQQPNIAYWNLFCLGQALLPLMDEQQQALDALEPFKTVFPAALQQRMGAKLGLDGVQPGDEALTEQFMQLLAKDAVDFTIAWRRLSHAVAGFAAAGAAEAEARRALEPVRDLFLQREAFDAWAQNWRSRLQSQPGFDPLGTQTRMLRTNPQVVLRNHLGEIAIQRAREGDFSLLQRLQAALEQPFDALPGCDDLADFPPEWAAQIEISCSS
jgi:uncharacterized protein YdiU (UPF0061 family)